MACCETLEGRRLLSLTATLPVADPTAPDDCGCHGGAQGGGYDVATFHVDDDRQQCRDAEFTSIQAAVAAAPPYSTIYVCPGLYTEEVVVPKPLRLIGSSHDRSDARSANGPDPRHDSIVTFPSALAGIFSLHSNDIELDGFVVTGNADGPGVYTSPVFSGYCIEYNYLTDNVFGLYLNSSGLKQTVVERNDFNSNNRFGAANGDGIYSDQGLRNALIEQNYFTGHLSAAMVLTNATNPPGVNERLVVRHNAIIDDRSIVVANSTGVVVEKNFIRRSSGTGIFEGGGNDNVLIDHNVIDETVGSGIALTSDFGPPSTNVVVTRNLVGDAGRNGILVLTTQGATVERNTLLRSGIDGIQLSDAPENRIAGNVSLHNGRDGIHVEGEGSAGNVICDNTMRRNGDFDAYDDTAGGGTAATANYWIDNNCKTENRPGLCGHSHDDYGDAHYAAQEESYATALDANPLVDGDVVIPAFEVPEEPVIPALPPLAVVDVVTGVFTPREDKAWLFR